MPGRNTPIRRLQRSYQTGSAPLISRSVGMSFDLSGDLLHDVKKA
ncbi:hypothetical protein SAMN02927900_03516 [Rhizobium mongolense subsp. loessense]|uniref:Uncharacterized protein n=1 Tax=Rhizobium mongolense subsp. loessense TaxID=158890 RepID=A0A1G4SA63_9HYPH|nr:hypothetical protein SAMN02927900_03516 [Rhizobium mongolense subsp. loessense]